VSGYAPVYYPGTTTPSQAAALTLAPSEERAGLDFQLQRVPVARVEGIVANATGQQLSAIQINLVPSGTGFAGEAMNARADAEGRFRLLNVAPGNYTLTASSMVNVREAPQPSGRGNAPAARPAPLRFWAMMDITVDGRNLANVALSLQPGMTLSGRVVFEGTMTQPPADLTRARVNLSPAGPGSTPRTLMFAANGSVDASGRFTITSVTPGQYRLSASSGGNGWSVKSAVIDGQDTLDFPIEIKPGEGVSGAVVTFTDRQSEISGFLTDGSNQPAPGYAVVVYPADERFWSATSRRIRTSTPATDGSFSFTSLPPGEYRIAPANDPEPGSWFEPAFLQQLESSSIRVTLGEGEKKTQTLRISR
jgi:hypothetical protein